MSVYVSLRNVFALLVLAAGALASWHFSRPDAGTEAPAQRAQRLPLGYYLTDAVLLGTDENGRVLYELSAEQIEEAPQAERLLLSGVRLEYKPAAQVPWLVSAASGEAPMDRAYLDLRGGVELASEGGESKTVLQTASLRLEPERFLAQGDEPVNVWLGEQQLSASGFRAYLKDDRLELESDVHGQFLP